MAMKVATCTAPTNIAVIKYCGKDDEALNTPLNSSVSVTLHQDQLRAHTSIASDPSMDRTRLWLNGKEQQLNKRTSTVLREMKKLAKDAARWENAHFHIVSENSFPTAAGLASSAAGYACLVATLAKLMDVEEQYDGQLSVIARQGSGSACRSLYGGFVRWEKGGLQADGSDSRAVQVADEHHWPELCAIICVVNDKQKDTSSTSGMQNSKATSTLLRHRADKIMPGRLQEIEAAYKAKDFETFGRITMQDSNQFHATCLDTFPPIFYMNDVSRQIVNLVHQYNAVRGRIAAAYTFDAGPNAVIFLQEQDVQELTSLLLHAFPTSSPMPIRTSMTIKRDGPSEALRQAIRFPTGMEDTVKMMYVTRVGGGTRVRGPHESLIEPTTGLPSRTSPTSESSDATSKSCPCAWQQLAQPSPQLLGSIAAVALVLALVLSRSR
ncbi:TPA: hypothetical protein N0F65_002529 [Lagenidium giganteum]|uniref:Diphosphomevalonate decarboxylase n=1 Tax=Lagenidium giganteum TaxID=4803 RepID=A0AAV2YQB0_9STRA|nr:TPA: hypothetical protein N0F65_002529 [Lagenidium giganteum]